MDRRRHRAWIDGCELNLTPTEFRLVWMLAEDPGRVFERRDLFAACTGDEGSRHARTIDVHVKAIRAKLGERADLVETVHGVGYRLCDPRVRREGTRRIHPAASDPQPLGGSRRPKTDERQLPGPPGKGPRR